MQNEEYELLLLARSMLRDIERGWPLRELCDDPRAVVDRITKVLGDGYNYETGEVP
jgi:hypothetical protein